MIVIPMAGLSSRFFDAGYTLPKYMLQAHGRTLFWHAVNSFKHYFDNQPFVFIIRPQYDTEAFVTQECQSMGIKDFQIISLEEATRGQAETVYLGIKNINQDTPITIFNIDTFRHDFRFPDWVDTCDGYLEVFKGEGDNWSYAKPVSPDSNRVIETAEKNPISDLCSNGLYHFSSSHDFKAVFETEQSKPKEQWQKQELYIAPLYNYLIEQQKDICYHLIDREQIIFCGVPNEYDDFLKQNISY